ncbi:transcriptional repressor [Dickeya chrysanthemi]|uniref:transcriptional repressor n=1 Tax=Dickeya chrysanthemi TaxID=556 RepID=UPI003AFB6F23
MLIKKRLRQTIPRKCVIEIMKNNKNNFLQVMEIYLFISEHQRIPLNVIYRVTRELFDAGVIERRWNEHDGRLTYRLF